MKANWTFFITSYISMIIALACALTAIGPEGIHDLLSKDPVKTILALCSLVLSLAANLGLAITPPIHKDN